MPPKRMTANPIRPARHRAGKRLSEPSSSSEDETDAPAPVPTARPPKAASAARITSSLSKVDLASQRRQHQAAEEQRRAAREELVAVEKKAAAEGFVTESSAEEESGEEEEDEDEESSEEESSEEEQPRRLIKPRFIPKHKRGVVEKTEEEKEEEERARRKAETDALIEQRVKTDLAAREARKTWGVDGEEEDDEVDDRDGLDPEAELAAFKLRKLKRYKRDREAMLAREHELEEIERRRNMTEEERKAEEEAKIARQKEEKESRGKMGFMQKYHHRGAFYQAEAEEAGLANRDIMGSKFADEVDRSTLPEYLQRRDMTRVGRKGASKYKDLRSEDTGRWGDFDRPERKNNFGVDERFRDDDRFRPGDGAEGRGANALPLGERRVVPGAPTGPRGDGEPRREDRFKGRSTDMAGDSYRPGGDRRRDRSRSRSRSPRDSRDGNSRKRRSTSRDRYRDDKRRKLEA